MSDSVKTVRLLDGKEYVINANVPGWIERGWLVGEALDPLANPDGSLKVDTIADVAEAIKEQVR